ncbi:MAG TPA: amidase [Gemmatimonadaceae bacterium]|jgi:amidase
MKRRDFLRNGALSSAALTGLVDRRSREPEDERSAAFDIEEATIADLQRSMIQGKRSSRSITEQYISRIESLDRRGPALHHVIEINPDAIAIATELDNERRRGKPRGPLHGIPILLKDNIETADRTTTTAGSLALEGSIPSRDSTVAQRLRAAGAVLLGKTNMSEWANFRSTHSTSGWSARGGQGKNPYALDRNPCGSSSGSGGAVSANYTAAAIGTETDGSVVCPSAINGIAGIKPTLGLVSRAGIIPIAHSQDTSGPMARTVADAALLLTIMAGVDPRDPETQRSRSHMGTDYTRSLDPNGLRGMRIGVPRKRFFGYSDGADRVIEEALRTMSRLGAKIVDPANMDSAGKYDDTELEVLLYEFKADLNAYLAGLNKGMRVKTLADIIRFNDDNKAREMPFFGQELFHQAQEKGPLTSAKYKAALAKNRRLARAEGIDLVMKRYSLDALVAPTGSPAWPTDLVNGDHFTGASSTPAAVAGYPNINVPAGFAFGLPVGISFFGAAFSEAKLIKIAYAYEQATRHRRPPTFPATSAGANPRA